MNMTEKSSDRVSSARGFFDQTLQPAGYLFFRVPFTSLPKPRGYPSAQRRCQPFFATGFSLFNEKRFSFQIPGQTGIVQRKRDHSLYIIFMKSQSKRLGRLKAVLFQIAQIQAVAEKGKSAKSGVYRREIIDLVSSCLHSVPVKGFFPPMSVIQSHQGKVPAIFWYWHPGEQKKAAEPYPAVPVFS